MTRAGYVGARTMSLMDEERLSGDVHEWIRTGEKEGTKWAKQPMTYSPSVSARSQLKAGLSGTMTVRLIANSLNPLLVMLRSIQMRNRGRRSGIYNGSNPRIVAATLFALGR
jgi:hypothetical protein